MTPIRPTSPVKHPETVETVETVEQKTSSHPSPQLVTQCDPFQGGAQKTKRVLAIGTYNDQDTDKMQDLFTLIHSMIAIRDRKQAELDAIQRQLASLDSSSLSAIQTQQRELSACQDRLTSLTVQKQKIEMEAQEATKTLHELENSAQLNPPTNGQERDTIERAILTARQKKSRTENEVNARKSQLAKEEENVRMAQNQLHYLTSQTNKQRKPLVQAKKAAAKAIQTNERLIKEAIKLRVADTCNNDATVLQGLLDFFLPPKNVKGAQE